MQKCGYKRKKVIKQQKQSTRYFCW